MRGGCCEWICGGLGTPGKVGRFVFRRAQMTAAMSQELIDELTDHGRCGLTITTALMESTINRINGRIKGKEKFWRDGPNLWSNSSPAE